MNGIKTNPAFLLPFILLVEGGWADDPDDKGGKTNKGVTISAWKSYGYDKTGDNKVDASDLRLLSDADVLHVLRVGYWDRWKADQIKDQAVANACVDWVWGSGHYGITNIQSLLGVSVDGVVGSKTIKALNAKEPKAFLEQIYKFHEDYYRRIATGGNKKFLNGWINRNNILKEYNRTYFL